MKEIGIGIIGCGFMGKTHTYGAKTIPLHYDGIPFQPRLVGVCDLNLRAAQDMKDRNGFEFATADIAELLSRKDIDAVTVSTPNVYHKQTLMDALAAGKHIYCDKPITVSYADALEVAAARKKSGLTGQMALQFRFYPATLRAKELIDSGKIGAIMNFTGRYIHSGSIKKDKAIGWKQDKVIGGGGVLFDLGSHILDLLRHFLGDFREIFASTRILYPQRPDKSGKMTDITADDDAQIILRLPSGAQGVVQVSKIHTGTYDELSFEVNGDKGAVRWNSMEPNTLEFYDNTKPDLPLGGEEGYTRISCLERYPAPGGAFPPPKFPMGWVRSHVHCFYSFLDCVCRGAEASPSFDDGAYVLHALEAAYASAESGTWKAL